MATNATSTGAIRPKNTSPLIYPDGTETSIVWVKEAAGIKRLRRYLANIGHILVITREGTPDRQRHGEYLIRDEKGAVFADRINLASHLRSCGLLADDERLDPPSNKGWRHYVARARTIKLDGIECITHERLTKDFTTEKAARKAAEGIEDREGLVICSWDASNRGGAHDD